MPVAAGIISINRVALSGPQAVSVPLTRFFGTDEKELENNFCDALQISREAYESTNFAPLRRLFALCDGHPYLVDKVYDVANRAAKADVGRWKNTSLTFEHAETMFQEVLKHVNQDYGLARWHAVLGARSDIDKDLHDDSVRERPSFALITQPIVYRLQLDILNDRSFRITDTIPLIELKSTDITYNDMSASGLIDVLADGNSGFHKMRAPLMMLMVMNTIAPVFPAVAEVDKSFDQSWATHERLAMASLRTRMLGAYGTCTQLPITDLRPGARWLGNANFSVTPVKEIDFVFWGVYIDNELESIMRGVNGRADKEPMNSSVAVLTFADEPAVDGILYLPVDKVLVLSQSKKCGLSHTIPGAEADTVLGNTDVLTLVESMRTQKDKLLKRFPHVNTLGLKIVYDIFSNREAPANLETTKNQSTLVGDLKLAMNEVVVIIRGDAFPNVLGSGLADLSQVGQVKRRRLL